MSYLKAESPNLFAEDNGGETTKDLGDDVGEHVFHGEFLGEGHHNRNGGVKVATRNFTANKNSNVKC